MANVLSLQFEGGQEPFSGMIVHRAQISAAMGGLYEACMLVHSTDPAVDPQTVVNLRAELVMDGEPYVDRVKGIIRAMRQLTSVSAGSAGSAAASYYEVVLTAALYSAAHCSGRRIFQNKDVPGIMEELFTRFGSHGPPPTKRARAAVTREYTCQYDETDLAFVLRILAEDHMALYFDSKDDWRLTLVDDPTTLTAVLPFKLPYVPPSNLDPTGPSVLSVRFEDAVGTGAVDLRDYDCEKPMMSRDKTVSLEGKAELGKSDPPFKRETELVAEGYEVGRFTDGNTGEAIAKRDLVGRRGHVHTIECETNLAIFPGTRFTIEDHPRPELGGELLVVGSRVVIDDGTAIPMGGTAGGQSSERARRSYSLQCVLASRGWFPARTPKPRAIGPESAFVVGSLGEGQIDVDEQGRVEVEFVWDRRDLRSGAPTRRVRVSQGWSGTNRGFVTLPRIGDEVLVGYAGGDPDQPMVVGRVHNAVSRTPLDLPDPDKTVSVWKSRTVGGDGFNQILMDDQPGAERLELRAERDRTDLVQHDMKVTVLNDYTDEIKGTSTTHIVKKTQVTIDDTLEVNARDTFVHLKKLELTIEETGVAKAAQSWLISAGSITLEAEGCSIKMANGNITIKASGQIDIESGGTMTLKGSTINLN